MIIIYPTRTAILDEIDGSPNQEKQIILDMQQYRNECRVIEIDDDDYQGFDVPESCWRKYTNLKGLEYWPATFQIAQKCVDSEYPKSRLSNVFMGIKADEAILNEEVPATLPGATYYDGSNTINRTFATWYQNPVPEDGIKDAAEAGKKLLRTNVNTDYLSMEDMLTLKAYAEANPGLNIEFLNKHQYLEERSQTQQ